ncbi:MAG: N-6 DNA methylase [Nitrospira sp.]|nr:N-6 DNA methylase [Nitrospira sp.]MDE0404398.1 N-6 DNA methylase [Nitrospira sp.]
MIKKFKKAEETEKPEGQIQDFVSGHWVKATPEEIDAVQIFSRRLIEDYDYPKSNIQTRPQCRVRKRPSDKEKSYPVDIAVFKGSRRIEDDLFMVVECKKKNRQDGLAQLKLYLDMSAAEIGVWFNGLEHTYLRKIYHKDGRRTYQDLPSIPRYGQRIEDIGLFKRKDLKVPSDLRAVFRDLRNHLAGNVTGITRDEALAQQIINLLFCKIYDEINTGANDIVTFRSGIDEPPRDVRKRILALFDEKVKGDFNDVFDKTDAIIIDPESLVYVVGELENYCITEAPRDAVGDAFEVFIGPALRGGEGQFFTPRNVVKMMINILDPKPGDMILDPASGSGGFLIMALEHVWKKMEDQAKSKGWSAVQLDRKKRDIASKCFRGIDKDSFLAKVTKAYMAIIGDGRGGIFCENSLVLSKDWHYATRDSVDVGAFNVVLTNPPFGTKIRIKGERILTQYELGYKWKKNKKTGKVEKTGTLHDERPPQVLFLERCLQFLKSGGRLGIVLPESILGNPSYEYLVTYILEKTKIIGVVTMPEHLFKTSGKGGTHCKVCALFLEKNTVEQPYDIFMADVKWCGHDSRGNPTIRKTKLGEDVLIDEVPDVAPHFHLLQKAVSRRGDHRGFLLKSDQIKNKILVPKYYAPELDAYLLSLSRTHDLVTIKSLFESEVLSVQTGIEIGKMAYGTGHIPFVRSSDLSNWEIKADFKHGVSRAIYEELRSGIDVQAGDILLVRDGTYLIGTTAIVTESDVPMLFQSHIYRFRVLKSDNIDPWLFFACLNTSVVKKQIRAKQFTQDIIDTLGKRIFEVILPIPKDKEFREKIARQTRETVLLRVSLRNKAKQISLEVEGITEPGEEDSYELA